MATAGIVKTKMLMLSSCRKVKRADRGNHKLTGVRQSEKSREPINHSKNNDTSCWVPHPRTGIYFPKGHEWVLNDVPENAASFSQTYWLRNVDGVDKPEDDHTPHDRYLSSSL